MSTIKATYLQHPSASNPSATLAADGSIVLPANTTIGNVSSTELGYVDGVTSAIQTQINGKLGATAAAGGGLTGNYPNPTIATVPASAMPSGSVVQVVQRVTATTQAWYKPSQQPTDCYCYITPLFSTSKILVMCSASVWTQSGGDAGFGAGIYGSTAGLYFIDSHIGDGYDGQGNEANRTTITYLTPAIGNTNNQYFQLILTGYQNNQGTTVTLNRNYQGTDYSIMTLMEIKA